jgi:succinate dehydrogenase / fumarate reductase flavoprotein subunit
MQGLADGYFIIPYTIGDYLATSKFEAVDASNPAAQEAGKNAEETTKKLFGARGKRTADDFHRELGKVMWDLCGMARNEAGLKKALAVVPALREEFWKDVRVPGSADNFNPEIERAGRVADFLELAELLVRDALHREESCGGHFREEYHTEEGEAKRDDERFAYVAAWEFKGVGEAPVLHKEPLAFEYVKPSQRSYK